MSIDIRTTRNESGRLVLAVSLVDPRGHSVQYREFDDWSDMVAYVNSLKTVL
jgi:hypothetical protein